MPYLSHATAGVPPASSSGRSGSRRWLWGIGLAVLVLALSASGYLLYRSRPPAAELTHDSPLDVLLGHHRREAFARSLASKRIDGKSFAWRHYADWGKQLVTTGRVSNPPTGAAPSAPIASCYRCIDCHNLVREDLRLREQDPEAREKMIRDRAPADPAQRDAASLAMLPGTTLWGAVNRERFYNGYYERYHRLKVSGGRAMDPLSLADAVEVCASYCSGGRFPQSWELDAILAFLWDSELKLKDLDLSSDQQNALLEMLKSKQSDAVREARERLKAAFLSAAGASRVRPPIASRGDSDFYDGAKTFRGDATRGKLLYQSACLGCHNGHANEVDGRRLARDDVQFHKYIWDGTQRSGVYMPLFTEERLSRRQAADIRAYLKSLPP